MRIDVLVIAALLVTLSRLPAGADGPRDGAGPFHAVRCEGTYPGHLQGVCTDGEQSIFWCFTVALVKTDADGRIVKRVDVASHHGDLCHHEGKVYVAVNLGEFNKPAGHADSSIYVYDARSLDEVARHAVPQVVHGAGGIASNDGRFIVVGGLPGGIDENYLYEYDRDFAFRKRHVLASGPTLLGIQTAAAAGGAWWFGCYGTPQVLLKADREFKLAGKCQFNASLGIVGLGSGRFLVARGSREADKGYSGQLVPAEADDEDCLRLVE